MNNNIFVREAIEKGLSDSNAGKTKDAKEIRAKYNLPNKEIQSLTEYSIW